MTNFAEFQTDIDMQDCRGLRPRGAQLRGAGAAWHDRQNISVRSRITLGEAYQIKWWFQIHQRCGGLHPARAMVGSCGRPLGAGASASRG